ncbi:MAG: hypothetical protein ACOCV2_00630 [Persicimonas sp.]
MWSQFFHQVTLHFPIVLSLVIAAVGLWSFQDDAPQLRTLVRWAGWICFGITTVTVVAGLFAAPGFFGLEANEALSHHRNLGLTAWVVMGIATISYEWGIREESQDWRHFGVCVWCVTALAVIGAGHWGVTEEHRDSLPWVEEADVESKDVDDHDR